MQQTDLLRLVVKQDVILYNKLFNVFNIIHLVVTDYPFFQFFIAEELHLYRA